MGVVCWSFGCWVVHCWVANGHLGWKWHPVGGVGGVCGFSAEDDSLSFGFDAWVGYWYSGDECVCVWVLWVAVELCAGCDFDDFSEVHYCDAVADVSDDGEVVSDE